MYKAKSISCSFYLFSSFVALTVWPPISLAADSLAKILDDNNRIMAARIGCESFDFNQKEMDRCREIYHLCMSPDLRPSERQKCIIDTVRNGKTPPTAKTEENNKRNPYPKSGPKMSFAFTPAQSYELLEMCRQSAFKSKSLCSEAINPNEKRIMSDLDSTIP